MRRSMQAVVAIRAGGSEVLEHRSVALPWPGAADAVLVRLKAAALNPADCYFRALGPYLETDAPLVLGHDGAGVVEEVGAAVARFKPGDRVCFCNGGLGATMGSYAQFAVVPASQLVAIPDAVDFHQAAALPLVLITAWEALYDRADLRAGEHVLIHGGAGGTGHMAVQLAALRQARVAATVSGPEKADMVTGLGVDLAIDYRQRDFQAAALDWTDGRGLEVALDNVGPDVMRRTYGAMAPYGRVVTLMGTPADDADETAYVQNLTIHNVMMLTPMVRDLKDRLAGQADLVRQGIEMVADGRLSVRIARVYPLSDIRAAHEQLDAGGTMGKIVMDIAP